MTIPPNYLPALIEDPIAGSMEDAYLAAFGRVCLCHASNGSAPIECPVHSAPPFGLSVAEMERAKAFLEAALSSFAYSDPAVIDGTPRVVGRDIAPHIYEPTTNTRCARCNQPREEH